MISTKRGQLIDMRRGFRVQGSEGAGDSGKIHPYPSPVPEGEGAAALNFGLSTNRIFFFLGLGGFDLLGGGDVVGELGFEGGDGIEGVNAAEAGQEFELERLAIERACEADEVGFDFEGLFAERGIGADVDRGGPVARRSECTGRIDALGGEERVDGFEVGRWKADFGPATGTVRDHAADAIGPREKLPGQIDVARLNGGANAAAGDDFAPYLDWWPNFERDVG